LLPSQLLCCCQASLRGSRLLALQLLMAAFGLGVIRKRMMKQQSFQRIREIFVGWGADEVPQSAALFRPPSPKPIVQLSLQWAFQHHLVCETDIGFRLIGLP